MPRMRELRLRQINGSRLNSSLDDTSSKLAVLYAKQGRAQQFTTQAARDKYLNDEIKSLRAYEKTQQKRVDDLSKDVEGAKAQLEEVIERARDQAQTEEDRRNSLKTMGEEITELKKEVDEMHEKRKSLWREDGKLGQTVANAKNEMDTAERALLGMMDKVSTRRSLARQKLTSGYKQWSSIGAPYC
jgi:structural maintenance of chromosome 3 (chondroitin sulfate proteoglycan 6)